MAGRRWTVWVDTGGTFTDGVAVSPDGAVHRAKVLSSGALRGTVTARDGRFVAIRTTWSGPAGLCDGFSFGRPGCTDPVARVVSHDPSDRSIELNRDPGPGFGPGDPFEVRCPEEAPVLAARLLTATPAGRALPAIEMRLATTLGTNALLQRRGVPTALFVTSGFRDLLAIGDQSRPDLFALDTGRASPLYEAVVEVDGRMSAGGRQIAPLRPATALAHARALLDAGVRVAAVALLHAHRDAAHERALGEALLDLGFTHVSLSSEVAPAIQIVPRAETTLVDAYLAPIVRGYLRRVAGSIGSERIHVMTSAGGLVGPDSFRPRDSLLSGPAGGVVGAADAGRRAGFDHVLAFDMGGTSTDVARFDGDHEYVFEHRVGEARVMAPALAIESVAAGGGSICSFDGDRLRVGPDSAGAFPGPACYGAGGPLTLTDVNLLLGRLQSDRFEIPIEIDAARRAFDAIRSRAEPGEADDERDAGVLEGFLDVANERMAEAIRRISLRRGYDPAGYVLVAFGGAGPQAACGVAGRLGVATILVPPDTGLLSAHGLGRAVIERFAEHHVLRPIPDVAGRIAEWLRTLEERAAAAVRDEGVPRGDVVIRRRLAVMRFVGQDASLETEITSPDDLQDAFDARYRALYGHDPGPRPRELVALRVVASGARKIATPVAAPPRPRHATPTAIRPAWFDGRRDDVATFERDALEPGDHGAGPARIVEDHSVTVVEPGWTFRVDARGSLVLESVARADRSISTAGRPEAVRLELFTHRFEAIAREMGERLRRTAVSTNIKERLDFSCAVLDTEARLVVNAPHIPVHLGALGHCVRRVRDAIAMEPGDVVVTNHPAFGGSHLPDVTVISPAHCADGALIGYVASRAHHAEIGGTRPGSMPPSADRLEQEGVVIPPTRIVRHGVHDLAAIRDLLTSAPHPSRSPDDNISDLAAAVAANHAGVESLRRLATREGPGTVARYMDALRMLAARRLRSALGSLGDGSYAATERLDDGTPLAARIEIVGDHAAIDFEGSGAIHPGNLNATPAIVYSAVMYVLRLLVREPIPLNEGLLEAVSIRIPAGILNPPFGDDPATAPAVVGGNVETSQRLVDALIRALGLAACSQGTMNNVLFGDDRSGYYETICGGGGGGPGFDGPSAIHTHMTNTRITDPEILEHRYPVRVEKFEIRRGSGGRGRWRGGDGVVRHLTFLRKVQLSVLTQHRVEAPYGLDGGESGAPGRQWIIRSDGSRVDLDSIDGYDASPGDRFVIETPGGGGYGDPHDPR